MAQQQEQTKRHTKFDEKSEKFNKIWRHHSTHLLPHQNLSRIPADSPVPVQQADAHLDVNPLKTNCWLNEGRPVTLWSIFH